MTYWSGFLRLLLREHTFDEAAVFAFSGTELREGGCETEFVAISAVDAGHERLDEVLKDIVAKPAADERAERFIGIVLFGRDDVIQRHAEFAQRRDELRFRDWPELAGNEASESLRHWVELTVFHDERATVGGIGGLESRFQTQLCGEADAARLHGKEALRAMFDHPAVGDFGVQHTPDAVTSLIHGDAHIWFLRQCPGGGESTDSAAHHCNVTWHYSQPASVARSRTSSARPRIMAG